MLHRLGARLTRITMYRLMLYYLGSLIVLAVIFSTIRLVPLNPLEILFNTAYLLAACYLSNQAFGRLFRASLNVESQYITALILTLIIEPGPLPNSLVALTLVAVVAMASKYLIAWKKRHVVNPAVFGALVAILILGSNVAPWWVANPALTPFVVIGGLIVAQRTSRLAMVGSFLVAFSLLSLLAGFLGGVEMHQAALQLADALTFSPIWFFVLVLLLEPLTGPQDPQLRIYYAAATGALFVGCQALPVKVPYTLELALLSANVLFRLVRFDPRISLILKSKELDSPGIMSFWFEPPRRLSFTAGQFLMLTVPHPYPDRRGNRRIFTIASSPTEDLLMFATKFEDKWSSFKTTLRNLKEGQEISALHLEGRFTLPQDAYQPLVFIAGGIGITPFRSMIRYMLDSKQSRRVTLFYANRQAEDFVFQDVFEQAELALALKTVYVLTGGEAPPDWTGKTGRVDANMIQQEVPDYLERMFYVSGPEPMVAAMEKTLSDMGIAKSNIKKDFFQGYQET